MVVIRCVERSFRQSDNLGWAQCSFVNDLFGFPSRKKIKVIYKGMIARECQGVLGNAKKY